MVRLGLRIAGRRWSVGVGGGWVDREGVISEAREESAIFAGVGGMVVSFHCL